DPTRQSVVGERVEPAQESEGQPQESGRATRGRRDRAGTGTRAQAAEQRGSVGPSGLRLTRRERERALEQRRGRPTDRVWLLGLAVAGLAEMQPRNGC